METITEFSRTLSEMPAAALVTAVVLAAFGLAAFAIHTVANNTRRR